MRLDARGSYDPDAAPGAPTPLRYLWLCTGTGIPACPPLPTEPSLNSFVTFSLAAVGSSVLTFRVVAISAADGRLTTSAPVLITRVLASLPQMDIQVSVPSRGGSAYAVITPNYAVVLAATVSAQPGSVLPGYSLAWTCPGCGLDVTESATAGGAGALLTAPTLPTLPTLVVRAVVMRASTAYRVVRAFTSLDPNRVSSFAASIVLAIGPLPGSGRARLQTAGVAPLDTFVFRCQAWQDDQANYPLGYQFNSISVDPATCAESRPLCCRTFRPRPRARPTWPPAPACT
jgi:hypothetical protein